MRIASVPADHVYVRHLADPTIDDGVRRLPDPPVPGAPAGRWWPPPMLEPAWVQAHAAEFDVLHVHFGFDDRTAAQLSALADAVHAAGRALVVTVHDLRNPHHADRGAHDAALDVLMPASDAVLTLTRGAAVEIGRRWGRLAVVVPHPHVVPLERAAAPRPRHDGFVVGLHAKGRANSDPVPVAHALAAALADLPGAHLRVDAPDDERGRAVAAELAGLDVRVHAPFTDDELWDHLADLDLSVLPYRFGTHSGWLEACHDLGTAVLAPDCGFYAEQAPCLRYTHDDRGASLTAAVRWAYVERPAWRADPAGRAAQRSRIAAVHARVYREAVARVATPGSPS